MSSTEQANIGDGLSRGTFEKDFEKASFVPVLLAIAKNTRALFELKLAAIGLHTGQDHLLERLAANGAMSISELGRSLGVRSSTVSKMADRLEQCGLVERTSNYGDGRITKLSITPDGEMMCERIEEVWHSVTDEIERSIGGGFASVIREMHTLDRCLSARLSRLR